MNKFKIKQIRLQETKLQKLVRTAKGIFWVLIMLVTLELLKLVIFGFPVIIFTRTEIREQKIYKTPDTPEEYILYKFGEVDGRRGINMLRECENRDMGLERINWNGNGTYDYGLWQINSCHGYTKEQLSDFKFNTDVAYQIFLRAGRKFTPWTCADFAGDRPFWK